MIKMLFFLNPSWDHQLSLESWSFNASNQKSRQWPSMIKYYYITEPFKEINSYNSH